MDPDLDRIIDRGIAEGLDDAELRLLAQEYHTKRTTPPAAATAGMPEMSRTTDQPPAGLMERMGGAFQVRSQHYPEEAGRLAATSAMVLGPGVLQIAGRTGLPMVQKGATALAKFLDKPIASGVIGAAEGARHGGLLGAAEGAVLGWGGSKVLSGLLRKIGGAGATDDVIKGMSQAGQSSRAATGGKAPLIDALMRGDSADDLIGMARTMRGTPAVAPKPSALFDEVLARQPIDWRTTDAVPIDAIKRAIGTKGGSIIEAGESIPGLAERMAVALKSGDATLAEKLARAIRQRMHITEKVRP